MKPEQRISTGAKLNNVDGWIELTANYFRNLAKPLMDYKEADILYKAATGKLQEEDYLYAVSTYVQGGEDVRLKSYPSKIRNWGIIQRGVLALMGEKTKRPIIRIVSALNSDLPNKQKEYEYKNIMKSLQQEFLNELYMQGLPIDVQTDENGQAVPPKSPEQIKYEASNLPDEMANLGQEFLEYADAAYDIPEQFRDNFFNWICTGYVASYKDVRKDSLDYQNIPPAQLSIVASRNITYLEDCEAVIRTFVMPIAELNDLFSQSKEYQDIKEDLNNLFVGNLMGVSNSFQTSWFNSNTTNYYNSTMNSTSNEVVIQHIVFTSECKIGYLMVNGKLEEVNEDYEPTKFDDINWEWVNQKWEGYIIADRYFIEFQPLPLQRNKMNNPFSCKNPYNGRVYGNIYAPFQSIVKFLLPYQIQYNLVKFHVEKLINKNKDKIVVMPLGTIPEKEGLDMGTTMYYADTTGYLWLDETSPQFATSMQAMRVLDASLSDSIMKMKEIADSIKAEADEMIGLNSQRLGQGITPSSGLGTTQEAIYRGSILTEELFSEYDKFQEKEYQGFLDLSPFIAANGLEVSYVSSDFKRIYRKFYGEDLQQIQFGIKVKSSTKEAENLETFKQWGFNFTQNGMSPSLAAKILKAGNLTKLIDELEEAEAIAGQKQQAQAEAENNIRIEEMNNDIQLKLDEIDLEKYKADLQRLTELDKLQSSLLMNQDNLNSSTDSNVEMNKLNVEREKIMLEIKKHIDSMNVEREKIKSKEKTDIYKADKSLEVAKSNRNKYDSSKKKK